MDNSLPHVEILPNHQDHHRPVDAKRSYRLAVFFSVFLLSLLLGLAYVYSRPALFKTHATLLTVAQTAIDQHSGEADVQHVAIQRQILMGEALLAETLSRLKQSSEYQEIVAQYELATELSVAEARGILSVSEVPDTNLVELAATGYQAHVFVPLINTWIEVYLEKRAEQIRENSGMTIEVLQEELAGLEDKILRKRKELEEFRIANEITSLGRENIFENQSLARFKGLNQSLSTANEEAIKSKARLDAVNKAIAEGKMVVPDEDKRGMRVLELRLQELREQLAEFDRKYTRNYLALNPNLNVLPGQIKELEEEIRKKRYYGQSIVLSEAQQDNEAAQQALQAIKQQLEEHKQQATEFSSRFSQHEALMDDLEGLELLQRTTQERLAQIEAKQAEKFPQVKVIEWAFLPREPISPDYNRDAIIAVVVAIFLGLFAVWLMDFLLRKDKPQASFSVAGINLYGDASAALNNHSQPMKESLTQETASVLQYDNPPSLEEQVLPVSPGEVIDVLLEASDMQAKQLIALLLSGLRLEEISHLQAEHFDFDREQIHVSGSSSRTVFLNATLKSLFQESQPCPAWNKTQPVTEQTLQAILVYASADAGFSKAQEISAESLTNAYIKYLVEQGLRLSELEQIVGYIEPLALSKFSVFSPEKRGLTVSEINLLHPSLSSITG